MHPAFWPMQAFVFWLEVLMLPWKMVMAPVADMQEAAVDPAALAGLDPVSPKEIGTSVRGRMYPLVRGPPALLRRPFAFCANQP